MTKHFRMYFEKPGKLHTKATIEVAKKNPATHGLQLIVAASTTGFTGIKAAEMLLHESANHQE